MAGTKTATSPGPHTRAWDAAVEQKMVGGRMTKGAAIRAVAREHPELRRAYLKEVNEARNQAVQRRRDGYRD